MPRRTVSAERLRQIQAAASCGCSDDEIAAIADVDVDALARPRVAKVVAAARANVASQVGAALLRKALGGNVPAAIFWLKARHGWRDTDAALEREAAERDRTTPRILVIEDADDADKAAFIVQDGAA